jgi:hypothetical protein
MNFKPRSRPGGRRHRRNRCLKSTLQIDGVIDGVARGFVVVEYLEGQMPLFTSAEMKSPAEGHVMLNNMFTIIGCLNVDDGVHEWKSVDGKKQPYFVRAERGALDTTPP